MAEEKKKSAGRPVRNGMSWLNDHLTRKVLLVLVFLCGVSLLAMVLLFQSYMLSSARTMYDREVGLVQQTAKEVCDFMSASDGDLSMLDKYAAERGISCTVKNGSETVYERRGESASGILAYTTKELVLEDGTNLSVTVWSAPISRDGLAASILRRSMLGVILLDVGIFVVVAVAMALLVFSPLRKLRCAVRDYNVSGVVPERTGRRDELGKLQNTFAEMVESLKAKEHDEHRLIASISHDIRTPLTSVMGYSERLLSAELPPEKQQRYLKNVYDKAVAIKSVVDEFDDYIEMGLRDDFPMQPMTVGELCDSLRDEYQGELADANVEFDIDCRCPKERIRCNYDRMRRFFGNLISNSINHAQAEHLKLCLRCESDDGQILLYFSDNGKGVPPEIIGQIFEPFFTSDKGRKVSGLGLSICRSIIQAHGGTIRAENLPEGGLLLCAALPKL